MIIINKSGYLKISFNCLLVCKGKEKLLSPPQAKILGARLQDTDT